MNEQLQKLYEQSFVIDSYVNVGPDGATLGIKFDPEKFAELIVRECVGIADEYDGVGSTIVSRIKKHFGVEE